MRNYGIKLFKKLLNIRNIDDKLWIKVTKNGIYGF